MSVCRRDAVVEGPQVGASHDEVHVVVGVIVLLKLQWSDLHPLQVSHSGQSSHRPLHLLSVCVRDGGREGGRKGRKEEGRREEARGGEGGREGGRREGGRKGGREESGGGGGEKDREVGRSEGGRV